MQPPLVSIVTPSYNQGRFIRATIESVLNQDYPHLEYIIMDGGSTDETASVVKEYADRLTWISEEDRGQSHAINKGFRIAQGEIVSWLNSDDIILPGALSHAVRAFERQPDLGAVYGEGYLLDIDGNITGRFPFTEPFNLWKLIYLSDYILQQTVYFRKSVFAEVGYLDESLHWGMDWDILIRVGKRYGLQYIPEYMGCLREHGEAKTFSGGAKRFRELARVMRRHGHVRYPPGYIMYGLDAYQKIFCNILDRRTPPLLRRPGKRVQQLFSAAAGHWAGRTVREAQGWYADGWATTTVRYMLPPGSGTIRIHGSLPELGPSLKGQSLQVDFNGATSEGVSIPFGDFDFTLPLLSRPTQSCVALVLRASRFLVPRNIGLGQDSRRLAYRLHGVEWLN